MRKLMTFAAVCAVFIANLQTPHASGPLGVFGIIEKVVFEPSDTAPERILVWGVFSIAPPSGGTTPVYSPAARGYLYYMLPSGRTEADIARKEWGDLKAVAGTGQAVGFGSGWMPATDMRLRPATEAPSRPSGYTLNNGIVKLSDTGSNANAVKQLKDALARK